MLIVSRLRRQFCPYRFQNSCAQCRPSKQKFQDLRCLNISKYCNDEFKKEGKKSSIKIPILTIFRTNFQFKS